MRLIDADALDFTISENPHFMAATLVQALKNAIDKVPTIEAEPVRHGRWIISSDGYYPYCWDCKARPKGGNMTKYCPNCGAKMDGDFE